jgi:pyruvate-formate lyase
MLVLFKSLTHEHGSEAAPFGFQYLPGCGTFENYEDAGTSMGASFDGRKKGQTLAQDYSPQNFLIDKNIGDPKYEFKPIYTSEIIDNYTYKTVDPLNPDFFSGAVMDLNIDESYRYEALVEDIASLAYQEKGTNLATITVCSREIMEQARNNTDRDLLRFRMGGWTEFAVAMFPELLEQQIRRVREIHPARGPLAIEPAEEYREDGRKMQKLL